ncbi:MAG TPA: leucyl/phenylalanyl-tRNA--protein transferase [Polyangiaceae bacterium]|nr:leucyl/phenylalanyl-tRNA--protein transferase [Polyangiaceae bacterium]
MTRHALPAILPRRGRPWFPSVNAADVHGLVAAGGSLSADWLLHAYECGIFPWYDEDSPPLWWSPDPRAVMDLERLHVSRSMERFIRNTDLVLAFDTAFPDVMRECGRDREDGTWILPETVEAYCRLHELGHAHSIEVWTPDRRLVGGLYGVHRGGLFAAESMFHRVTNASKLALIAAVRSLFQAGITLFDVQFVTPHLASLGAYTVPRAEYMRRLASATASHVSLGQLELAAT